MMYQTEPQIQAIVRRVAAKLLRAAGAEFLADKLDDADPVTIGDIQPLIQEARQEWEHECKVVAMQHDGVFWSITPKLEEHEVEGPLVHFHWGWEEAAPKLTTSGDLAFDLAVEILDLFTNEDGDPIRPERPEYPQPEGLERRFEDFAKLSSEFMDVTGDWDGCSFLDVSLWVRLGKPSEVLSHEWVDYPEDQVRICSACHHWYSTDPEHDSFATSVCPGEPIDHESIPTTDKFDPRRSSALREAQRLDKLVYYMKHGGATKEEIAPLIDALAHHKNQLTESELERYDKERIRR